MTVRFRGLWAVDTNVLVAGLLTADATAPPAVILDAMLNGRLRHLLCVELLAEYRTVLLRPRVQARHGLAEKQVDGLLEALSRDAVVANITGRTETAPDPGDNHLWRLLACHDGAGLITGDDRLLKQPPPASTLLTPRRCLEDFAE